MSTRYLCALLAKTFVLCPWHRSWYIIFDSIILYSVKVIKGQHSKPDGSIILVHLVPKIDNKADILLHCIFGECLPICHRPPGELLTTKKFACEE